MKDFNLEYSVGNRHDLDVSSAYHRSESDILCPWHLR